MPPYDIERRTGELKGITILINHNHSEGILRFILRSSEAISRIRKAIDKIQTQIQWVEVISCNIQPIPAALPEGPEEVILTAKEFITEDYGCAAVMFRPLSFMQVTYEVAARLYARFAKIVEDAKIDSMFDLYCGVGAFSLAAAPFIKRGIGIEISQEAIHSAESACALKGIFHLRFFKGDLSLATPHLSLEPADLFMVNPPRRGLDSATLELVLAKLPTNLVYSSCNPDTLVRDLSKLTDQYDVKLLAPFDMFPLTEHLEALIWLKRR